MRTSSTLKSPTIRQVLGVSTTLALIGIGLAFIRPTPISIALVALAAGLLMGLVRPKATWSAVLRPGIAIAPLTYIVGRQFRHDAWTAFVPVLAQAMIIALLADALLLILVWRRREWTRAA